jgi:Ca2+-transporting ATPase
MTSKSDSGGYYDRSREEVLDELGVDRDTGLDDREASRRLQKHGRNELRRHESRSAWVILLSQFKSMVIIVLVIAGAVAFTFQHWAEGIAIGAVLVVNAVLGFVTEWRAVRSMEALQALGGDTIRVRRDGRDQEIDAKDLVPGDIVVFEGGDLVPADIRLIEANNVGANESALTGESVPVRKSTEPVKSQVPLGDRSCMLYKGTMVTDGTGEGVVVGTGMSTELGRISELAESAEKEATPLQRRLDRLGRRLAYVTLSVAAIIAGVGLAVGQDPTRMIETAVALGVAAIPEGLPIVATVALARGMYLMAQRNALINKLPAVETLGATRTICTDKTGTLTENQMSLRKAVTPAGDFVLDESEGSISVDRDGSKDRGEGEGGRDDPLLRRLVEVGVLCNNAAVIDEDGDQVPEEEQGDPTETALLRAGYFMGMDRDELLEEKPEEREVSFDPDVMMMATYHRTEGGLELAVKGAPSRVLDVCDRIAAADGDSDGEEMDDALRDEWKARGEELAADGLRVLAMADKVVDSPDVDPYEGLRFVGLAGLYDPPREKVKESVDECQAAGIRVVMVTGDQPATAAAIARQAGLVDEEDRGEGRDEGEGEGEGEVQVVLGEEARDPDELSEEKRSRLLSTSVFARVSPEQKLNIIKLLQSDEQVVAMTGDGVNDTPALKKADIGVAMGLRGTDAARQVADMVLRDDAFTTIVAAVHQGRVIFNNIRKSVMFMLCTNVAEVIAVAVAAAVGGFTSLPIPLLPLQILYLNVITDVFPAIALGTGRGDPDVMSRPPRPHDEPVLTRNHWGAVGGWATLMSVCVLGGLVVAFYALGFDRPRAITVSFLTLAFSKLWFVYNLRTPGTRFLTNDIVRNPYIAGSIVLCIVLLLAAVYLPGLSTLLSTEGPGLDGWGLILAMSLVPFVVGQSKRAAEAHRGSPPSR